MFRLADPGAIFAGGAVAGRLAAIGFAVAGFAAVLPFLAGGAGLGLRAAGLLGRATFFPAGFVFAFFFFAALGIRLFYLL